ncbi:lipopolysaccharide kinase InaA family protein [Flavobacterium flavipallidum]|uniref:Lipopolysaccharide kinase InaA family protein n=1 Tax=Flavobacterium flavipallidum TaxID=3139140 RepID=A0ABU9HQD8_9FLAO
MKIEFSSHFLDKKEEILKYINDFNKQGTVLYGGTRNLIKTFDVSDGLVINVKAFKIPKFFNQFVYAYIRKSKARRSFENANYLINHGFCTPKPIAFIEEKNWFGLQKSYYISEQLEMDLMFRGLTTNTDYPGFDKILKAFAQFSYRLHEKGIEFIDNTSGNTLIKKGEDGRYEFYLVDLNRMNFHQNMSFELRMTNMAKLTSNEKVLKIICAEYAKLIHKEEHLVYETLKQKADNFQYSFHKRRELKNKILFWRKKKKL